MTNEAAAQPYLNAHYSFTTNLIEVTTPIPTMGCFISDVSIIKSGLSQSTARNRASSILQTLPHHHQNYIDSVSQLLIPYWVASRTLLDTRSKIWLGNIWSVLGPAHLPDTFFLFWAFIPSNTFIYFCATYTTSASHVTFYCSSEPCLAEVYRGGRTEAIRHTSSSSNCMKR